MTIQKKVRDDRHSDPFPQPAARARHRVRPRADVIALSFQENESGAGVVRASSKTDRFPITGTGG